MRRLSSLLVLVCAACGDAGPTDDDLGRVPDLAGVRLEVMYAYATPEGGRFGGLDGALAPGLSAELRRAEGGAIGVVEPDAHGRFAIDHDVAVGGRLELVVEGETVAFTVRDPASARREAVRPPLTGVGLVPNDLRIVGGPQDARGVVVRSGDNAVNLLDLETGFDGVPLGVRLPDVPGDDGPVSANPWLATPLDDRGSRVAVTAFLQARTYVLNLDAGTVVSTLALDAPVTLAAPFSLDEPFDVDGDGTPETEVQAFRPSSPQPVVVAQDRLLVAYASLLRAERGAGAGPIMLPGVVAAFDPDEPEAPARTRVLPFRNPQEMRVVGDDAVWVTCSGMLRVSGGVRALSPGGLVRLDPGTLAVTATVALDDFAPTTMLFAADRLWVASLARAEVLELDPASGAELGRYRINDEGVDSVFRLLSLPGGQIGIPSFNTDRLHVLDPRTGTLDAPPYLGPLALGPGRPVFDGLQIVARRPGRAGVDYVGPDLFALSSIAARVVPVELRRVLGP